MKNRRPKNKESLAPKKAKVPEKKTVLRFTFEDLDKVKYGNGSGRLKIDVDGNPSFFIYTLEGKWKGVKGKLLSLKVTEVNRILKRRHGK